MHLTIQAWAKLGKPGLTTPLTDFHADVTETHVDGTLLSFVTRILFERQTKCNFGTIHGIRVDKTYVSSCHPGT